MDDKHGPANDSRIVDLELRRGEAWALLRVIEAVTYGSGASKEDLAQAGWVHERLFKILTDRQPLPPATESEG
jgi:hypothetical protein